MYSKNVTGQIIFYYAHKALFENVQHQSAFMCKNIASKEGEDLSERYAITDDEEPMFELCLKETLPDIYDVLKPITHAIENAVTPDMEADDLHELIDDEDDTIDDEDDTQSETQGNDDPEPPADTNVYVVFRVQDNGAYNPNTLRVVDSSLRSSVEQGVLSNFYTRVTHPDLTKLAAQMFLAHNGALANRIVELRKKSVL